MDAPPPPGSLRTTTTSAAGHTPDRLALADGRAGNVIRLAFAASIASLAPGVAFAEPTDAVPQTVASLLSGVGLSAATTTVLTLFMIAVLLESALALLFNWRPFVETFNARATRPLVAFVVAWIFVTAFQYDAVTALMRAVRGTTVQGGPLGSLLTAAILAGGSAGVNTLLVALGFRQVRTPATEVPKVPPQCAWIALYVTRTTGTGGDVLVQIGPADPTDAAPFPKLPLAGVISPVGPARGGGLRRFFLKDPNRFPAFGGYEMPASQPCRVVVTAEAQGAAGTRKASAPLEFVPGPGAIIDLHLEV